MSLTGRHLKPTHSRIKNHAVKAVVAISACALILSSSAAQADSPQPTPKPSPSQQTATNKKAVDDYLSKRTVAVAASRARKASSLRLKIAKTRQAIARAQVNGAQIMAIAAAVTQRGAWKGTIFSCVHAN